ncbi:hypothetical protein SAMN05421788_102167 [Filimonas lacunae]|uniref:DUF7674 domain-containing protein n=1 Tax=Filimonas lacunae TaxID=477680 RepID=A0A173MIG3_9BACT|nr:hypothetical protein [Filimonas lacunae]BAV07211.1 hypothetical protein FLA_3234 [Filimonas lacunae]SIS93205.1 hypothetical protein SAMN05421788_102167 [Filimonas lacunae]
MNQYEVPALIAERIPELRDEIIEQPQPCNVNNAVHILANYTQKMCNAHDLLSIQKCMKLADRIYTRGNAAVQNAVVNVFVYSFSAFRLTCNKVEWRLLQAKMPINLYSAYVQQVLKSGI